MDFGPCALWALVNVKPVKPRLLDPTERATKWQERTQLPEVFTATCEIPIVSIVVPFWGLPYRILHIKLVKPKKGTTMETIGISG